MASLLFGSLCILAGTAVPARADGYGTLASRLESYCRSIPSSKIVILPFAYVDKRDSPGSSLVSERISMKLAALKGIRIIDRNILDKILEEMKLRMKGELDESALMKIGKALNADVIITGTLIDLESNEVEINSRVTSISDGLLLGVDRGVVEKDWQDPGVPLQRARSAAMTGPILDADSFERLGVAHKLFQSRCASCHGYDGSAKEARLSPSGVNPKNLDLTSAHIQARTDEELSVQIARGGSKMPPYGNLPERHGKIPPEQITELILYIRALNRASNALSPQAGEPDSLGVGASIYLKSCVYCHGFSGRGLSRVAERFDVKKSAMDLTRMDLDDMPAEKLTALFYGGGTKMPPLSQSPSGDELNGLLHYIHALSFSEASARAAESETDEPSVDVDIAPKSAAPRDPNAYAVVIGIEKYRQDGIPSVDFAVRDAEAMYAYLTRTMGFDPKNVVLLTNEYATKTDLEKNLGQWLENRVDVKSRVFVYYAGHGAPNPVTGEGYLMPYEADPNYLDDTAFPLSRLYAGLGKLSTTDVTVVLDACFSGRGGRSLIAKGARPLVTAAKQKVPANIIVLAAAASNQISASDPQHRHGLLTYYVLSGLHGAANANGDGRITTAELYSYVRPAVERAARLQNIEQTPLLSAAPERLASGRPWVVLAKQILTVKPP